MVRAGLSRAIVVETAARIVDEEGLTDLTMAELAKRLGIALPSLYTHVRSLEHLRSEVALSVTNELSRLMGEAIQGYAGRDAVFALARAYRSYAVAHAGRYAMAMLAQPGSADDRHQEAAMKCGLIVYGAVRGYGIAEAELTDAARFLRAGLHGFVSLEGQGGFALPQIVDVTFNAFLAGIDRALSTWSDQQENKT
ncbi:TetR/AcrR family transcriptional regulator [Sinorhizobium fredii]|uniref:TetR/AcrR family transcriptional regulator n=1 Tax=Rhizobium fredii TaxID=380 RepID=A0A2A6LQD0_RHIFR|nr:TetR/AcrR family transcriptional regulator [Sinorhizobium fredii]PDT44500.1 TetR/AcrR family transcriptional regulator [Sinorhizobium fredii]WOS65882.1 WHG domain-containing protein [Sinorhizobium fredii GR64]